MIQAQPDPRINFKNFEPAPSLPQKRIGLALFVWRATSRN